MKKIVKKNLTSNSIVNKLLVTNMQLSDKLNNKDTCIDLFKDLYRHSQLTKDDLYYVLYEIFNIRENLSQFDESTVLTIAQLGFEHEQILNSKFTNVKRYFADHYLYLDTLLEDHDEEVRDRAHRQVISYDRMTKSSNSMQRVFDALNLRDYLSVSCISTKGYHAVISKPVIWSDLNRGVSIKIEENQDQYRVQIQIDKPVTYNFAHDTLQKLAQYNMTVERSEYIDSVRLKNLNVNFEVLIDFLDWFFADSI